MTTQELLAICEENGKKVSRQYIGELKQKLLIEGIDYKQFKRLTIFTGPGVEKIFKKLLKK